MKALRLRVIVAVLATLASFPSLATTARSPVPTDEPTGGITNWAAPPHWSPTVSREVADRGDRAALASGRQALAAGPVALPFIALPPCRLVDTRGNGAPLTGGWLPAATERSYTLAGVCNVPANAQGISLNATAVKPAGPGFLVLYPAGGTFPPVSTLNYLGGDVIVNAAVVPLSATGGITIALGVSGGDVLLDTNGYYAATPSVASLNTLTGDVNLVAGTNVTLTPGTGTLTIAATAGGGGPPSGPAGGSLSGTYPNPEVAAGAIGPTQLANATAVRSINGAAQDLVTIQGSGGVSVLTAGSTVTIGAPSGSIVWGAAGDTTLIGAGFTEIGPSRLDYWMPTATTNAPSIRHGHGTVWTGAKMIVWGGYNGSACLDDGAQYDPVANSWTATAAAALSGRSGHAAVWTGSKMIVWGGWSGSAYLDDGARYDPVANSWTATAAVALSGRSVPAAVWTGAKMIVWGGWNGSAYFNDGGQYDPVANSWTATAATALSGRYGHATVWTGSKMIVWGGWSGSPPHLSDGGRYDPVANTWAATAAAGIPGRYYHTAVWTGSRMIVWGGFNGGLLNDGGQYDPVANTWAATTMAGAPSGRYSHTALWTGSRMIVWGYLNDGGQYDPVANTWAATTTAGAPSARTSPGAIWTGSKMIVWGGWSGSASLNDGGQWGTMSIYMKN